jgi:hypothetical protein
MHPEPRSGVHVKSSTCGRCRFSINCFSYARAERLKVALLFAGDDFSRTDLDVALR